LLNCGHLLQRSTGSRAVPSTHARFQAKNVFNGRARNLAARLLRKERLMGSDEYVWEAEQSREQIVP
jgi:hypothetical protein